MAEVEKNSSECPPIRAMTPKGTAIMGVPIPSDDQIKEFVTDNLDSLPLASNGSSTKKCACGQIVRNLECLEGSKFGFECGCAFKKGLFPMAEQEKTKVGVFFNYTIPEGGKRHAGSLPMLHLRAIGSDKFCLNFTNDPANDQIVAGRNEFPANPPGYQAGLNRKERSPLRRIIITEPVMFNGKYVIDPVVTLVQGKVCAMITQGKPCPHDTYKHVRGNIVPTPYGFAQFIFRKGKFVYRDLCTGCAGQQRDRGALVTPKSPTKAPVFSPKANSPKISPPKDADAKRIKAYEIKIKSQETTIASLRDQLRQNDMANAQKDQLHARQLSDLYQQLAQKDGQIMKLQLQLNNIQLGK